MPGTIASLWPQVYEGFAGVDCILHAGDLHVASVIDELEQIAPTFVCYGNGDLGVEHHKLKNMWIGELAGRSVGLIHKFPNPRRANAAKLARKLSQAFVDVNPEFVIYGHTHLADVHNVDGRTYINPGSPTLPNNQSTRHGTVGFMEISSGQVTIELHQINEDGLSLISRHTD